MPQWKFILRDRRVWLIGVLGFGALLAGRWLIPSTAAVEVVAKTGYWVMLAAFVLFVRALWAVVRPVVTGWRPNRSDVGAVGVVLLCGGVWLAHERQGFKILADEVLLLGTSMVMHEEREVAYPARATDVRGPFEFTHRVVDKRPFFFPFLTSLVHDVTGYRATNPFYVNTVLGFVFLGLVYLLGWRVARERWAGIFAVLLFGGLPLMAQQATGGGFELLNLVMLSVVLLLAWRYADAPDESSLEALCLAAILLAFARYESVLMILPVAGVVLWGWSRGGRVILTWPVIVAPGFLLPYVLQNRVFEANQSAWELASKPEAGAPFALHYVPDNLGHALGFFFDVSGYQPNSVFFGAVGLAALPFFALLISRALRGGRATPSGDWVLGIVALGWFVIGALLMAYFWGQFDHPVIRRLSLPVHLLMAVGAVAVGARMFRSARGWQWASGAAVLALVLQGLPSLARQAYAWEYTPGIEMAWRQNFLREHPQKDYLFIDRDSVFWIVNRVPATAIAQAVARKDGLAYHLRNRSFAAMYVFQRFNVDQATGALTVDPADDIGGDFELEPVVQRRVATLHLARISRILAIREKGAVVARDGVAPVASGPTLTKEDLEKAKAQYLEKWIKELP